MENKLSGTSFADEKKILALIELLGDDDIEISQIARQQLLLIGKDAAGYLEQAAVANSDGRLRIIAQEVLQQIRMEDLLHTFRLFAVWQDELLDLEYGAFLLAKFAYPNLSQEKISLELDRLATRIEKLIIGLRKPRRIVQIFNNVLYTEADFKGNSKNFYSPENSYLNKVLENRTGIPISLSLVYILLAKRLDIPIYGVSMPAHFICRYEDRHETLYIDAYDYGRVLNESECFTLLQNYGIAFNPDFLRRASNREILSRMIRNLILVYYQNEQERHANFLKKLLKIIKSSSPKPEIPNHN